jgi:hypothetical protein
VEAAADPGSFRDPLSRVFVTDDAVYRGLSEQGLAEFEAVAGTRFFGDLQREGRVVPTEQVAPEAAGLPTEFAGALRHERLPVVTYPYEWTFTMLRDAALAQLEVTRRALTEGFLTKDATSYNVVFRGTDPVFVDVGSFEKARTGEQWRGYRQFCELFLNPLVLQAIGGIPFQPLLRGSVHGISPAAAAAVVRGRHRLRWGLVVHVRLQARAERKALATTADREVEDEMKRAGFGPRVIAAQLDNLERTVRKLRWDERASVWSDYADRSHYTDLDLAAKEDFVGRAVAARISPLVLDLGANDGRFSSLALDRGARLAVAVDSDHLVVDRLYRHLRATGERRLLPLVMDLSDPSPSTGWRSRERPSFTERVRPDLVLCLAVVHHLALTNTVPFDQIVAYLADFGAPLVVELPHRDDPMAARLLARKRTGLFDHYDLPQWEDALGERFVIDERRLLPSGRRTLYRCTPR